MPSSSNTQAADGSNRRRLFASPPDHLSHPRIRRILQLSGYDLDHSKPVGDEMIGIWGQSSTPSDDEALPGAATLRIEQAFLGALGVDELDGVDNDGPLGLFLDQNGVHFDPATVCDLEDLLATAPLDDTALLNRARTAVERLKSIGLSKYNGYDPDLPLPAPGYVLVVDQPKGSASVVASNANTAMFKEMLVFAQEEHPGAQIIIKPHPKTSARGSEGHYGAADASTRVSLLDDTVSPWALMEGAIAIYTVSSQLGFEAIFAGHKPRVFGQPFYAGWGLTEDQNPVPRRQRTLTRPQLFGAAMILYPKWYDPFRDKLCELERVIDMLEAQVRAWREDRNGHVAVGMRRWKRNSLQAFYGRYKKLRFENDPVKARKLAQATGASQLVWASQETPEMQDEPVLRVEDGFLRSQGLGATLNAPLSLVADDLGIYYDPTRDSRLETLINLSTDLPDHAIFRSERLIRNLTRAGLSKYNIGDSALPDLPVGHRVLVPGQVEDDASILKGCDGPCRNIDLLQRARAENPDAVLIYKPHPDVEAGLRQGLIPPDEAAKYADVIASNADPIALIDMADEIWTLTSLLGFEALLRGKSVTCLGVPFYAGWGMTRDLAQTPDRRYTRPTLAQLAHATLIDYPRYFDPVTQQPCPPEVVLERLQNSMLPRQSIGLRLLSRLQGLFASFAYLWR